MGKQKEMPTAYRRKPIYIIELEERLYITLDVAERHRLLQSFIKELAG
jgi:hypothetical protein